MIAPRLAFSLGFLCLLAIWGCKDKDAIVREGELLAKLSSQELYAEDVKGLIPPGTPAEDSVQILLEYVNRWVREAAMLEEAERVVGADLEIEILVKDYRASLLRSRYEDRLALEQVDSMINESEIESLYEKSGDGMLSNTALVRATVLKLPIPVPEQADFEAAWYGRNEADSTSAFLKSYISEHAILALTNSKDWQPAERLRAILPVGEPSSIKPGTRVVRDDNYVYYLRIYETIEQGEPAPLAYVRDRLHKILLEERRSAFIGEIKERLYANARQNDAVKIYVGNEE